MAGRLRVAALVGILVLAAGLGRSAVDRIAGDHSREESLLYLPNGKYLKVMSLGHANLLADVMYLWAIQYYSDYEREHRHRYVEHVFRDVITELDPHYVDAYWLGALILIVESEQFEAGIRLLELGADRNPDKWILPYLAAWECYHAGRYERAAAYFERASRVPGAPGVVRRMRAGMIGQAGDQHEALGAWREILEDPSSDPLSRKIARRKVRELQTKVDVAMLEAAVERFRNDNGNLPSRLEELLRGSYIPQLPLDADGRPYVYEPRTGRVSSRADRLLGGN
jgi:tetratricopeptide (TPR) repeat protein